MTHSHLFKYRDFSARSLTALSANKMFFANPSLFNDPFDCSFVPEYKATTLQQFLVNFETPIKYLHQCSASEAQEYIKRCFCQDRNKFIKDMREAFKNTVLRGYGVYSLSAIDNDILMWAHYADSHKGFCLEFNRTEDNFLQNARKVNYPKNDEYPALTWPKNPNEGLQVAETIVRTKSRHWKYEQEWRMLEERPDSQEAAGGYIGHEVDYPNDMLAGIIFGERMSSEHRNVIKQLTTDKDLLFKEAVISAKLFAIEIILCD